MTLVLRMCKSDGSSTNGFKYGQIGDRVKCPDWNSKKKCGNGLIILYLLLIPYFIGHPINFPFSDGILVAPYFETVLRMTLLVFATIIAGYIPARMIVRRQIERLLWLHSPASIPKQRIDSLVYLSLWWRVIILSQMIMIRLQSVHFSSRSILRLNLLGLLQSM